jgi:hypothetical protein
LIVEEWDKARTVLEQAGFAVRVNDVVAIEVPDRPGGLADLLEVLERARVNVEYMYAFTAKHEGKGLMLFRFDSAEHAISALQANNVNVVGTVELFQRLGA